MSSAPLPLLLFPSNPLRPTTVDSGFTADAEAAEAAGFAIGFIDLEIYLGGEPKLRRVPSSTGEVLYRGWILELAAYHRMSEAVAARGGHLVTDPDAYRLCYHLPEWYTAVGSEARTPRSLWLPGSSADRFDLDAVAAEVKRAFGAGPVIVKDYVKSRKHEWFDACFIPAADDEGNVKRVVGNFLRLQEEHLVGGLVFRAFVDFERIGLHSKSRLPLVREYRFFVLDRQPIYRAPYWAEGDYAGEAPGTEVIAPILPLVKSRFYAVDVAKRESGGWMIVELNDGGSAGIPDGGSHADFYRALREARG